MDFLIPCHGFFNILATIKFSGRVHGIDPQILPHTPTKQKNVSIQEGVKVCYTLEEDASKYDTDSDSTNAVRDFDLA